MTADTQSVIVAYDTTNGVDKSVMAIGKKKQGQDLEIINVFSGEEAEALWKKLTTKKEATNV